MWSSIEQIIKPETLTEASVLIQEKGSVLFTGGSYLLAQKDPSVHTLIDINHLISDDIRKMGDDIHIGSGCVLQKMVNFNDPHLTPIIQSACPSKNIRNQRTVGGEIAKSRSDSDLLVFLFTARAKLLVNDAEIPMEISDWNGEGIITKVIIPRHQVSMERVALLNSAPAFVIVGMNLMKNSYSICVGGKTSKILILKSETEASEAQLNKLLDEVENCFDDDHIGSSGYKRQVVAQLLNEMASKS